MTLASYENNINGGGDYAEKVANSSLIGSKNFTYNGTTYQVRSIYSVLQHHYRYLSRFVIKLYPYIDTIAAKDYTNWTLYVNDVAFPFTQERMVGSGFRWRHPMFYQFRPGTTFELRIEETAISQARAINEPPPAPMYLTVLEDDSYLSVDWERPPMDEGPDVLFYNETSVPEVTRYRLELKKADDTWSSARSKSISYPSSRSVFVNLNNGVEYTMRVFAINQYGESPPSPEVTGTPHEMTPPGLLKATVDGSTLILVYDEALDGDAVPEVDTFTVLVNGSDRVVQSVSIDGSQVKLTLAAQFLHRNGRPVIFLVDEDTTLHKGTSRLLTEQNLQKAGFPIERRHIVTPSCFEYAFSDDVWCRVLNDHQMENQGVWSSSDVAKLRTSPKEFFDSIQEILQSESKPLIGVWLAAAVREVSEIPESIRYCLVQADSSQATRIPSGPS